ncbi:MAG TPA: tetratricopeptide repeat protein [Bacilli bacterium]
MDGDQFVKKAYASILAHDFEQAISWFEQAIAADPGNASYHYKLSITCARSNKLHKAIEHAQKAIELNKTREEYQFHLYNLRAKDLIIHAGKYLHYDNRNHLMAISLLKQAIALDPLAIEAFLLMGVAYAGLEDYNYAIQAIKEALVLDPQHETASELLTEYIKKQKKNS